MSLLKIPTSKNVTATVTIEDTTAATIDRYAAFTQKTADEVVNAACKYVFEKDKQFLTWSEKHSTGRPAAGLRLKKTPASAKNSLQGGVAAD